MINTLKKKSVLQINFWALCLIIFTFKNTYLLLWPYLHIVLGVQLCFVILPGLIVILPSLSKRNACQTNGDNIICVVDWFWRRPWSGQHTAQAGSTMVSPFVIHSYLLHPEIFNTFNFLKLGVFPRNEVCCNFAWPASPNSLSCLYDILILSISITENVGLPYQYLV